MYCYSIHACIGEVLHHANSIQFPLLILKGLTDILGNMWRCNEKDICVVEVTVLEQEMCCWCYKYIHVNILSIHVTSSLKDKAVAASALSFLNLLPRVKCVSPLQLREANGVLGELIIK